MLVCACDSNEGHANQSKLEVNSSFSFIIYLSLDTVVFFSSTSQFYSLNKFLFYLRDISSLSFPPTNISTS
jgi:hypothetical protein